MKLVINVHYPDGKQISHTCPPGVEITDHLGRLFQSVSSQKSAGPLYSQDVERVRIACDYVFVLMRQPFALASDEDGTTAAMTTEVYLVPLGTGQAISIDRIRVAVLGTFGPKAMDVGSLQAYGNSAGDREGKRKINISKHNYACHVHK